MIEPPPTYTDLHATISQVIAELHAGTSYVRLNAQGEWIVGDASGELPRDAVPVALACRMLRADEN